METQWADKADDSVWRQLDSLRLNFQSLSASAVVAEGRMVVGFRLD